MLRQNFRRMVIIGLCCVLLQGVIAFAQDSGLDFSLDAEHDIGFECPVSTAIQPGTEVLWVLMDNCGGNKFSLHAYDLNSGEPVGDSPVIVDTIDGNRYSVDSWGNPLTFVDDQTLHLAATDSTNDYSYAGFMIDLVTGKATTTPDDDSRINDLLAGFGGYAMSMIYSRDHKLAITSDDVTYYVLDLTEGTVLFEIESPGGIYGNFSADSQQLYFTVLDEPDNYDNYNSKLFIYSLPDGAVEESIALVTPFVYPSPDGRYLAIQTGDSQVGFVELATGNMSPLLAIDEEGGRALKCLNSGKDLSDVDFTKSGSLPIKGLQWLPDGAGFITVNTYSGQAVGGGSVCYLDYSRLRQYSVASNS